MATVRRSFRCEGPVVAAVDDEVEDEAAMSGSDASESDPSSVRGDSSLSAAVAFRRRFDERGAALEARGLRLSFSGCVDRFRPMTQRGERRWTDVVGGVAEELVLRDVPLFAERLDLVARDLSSFLESVLVALGMRRPTCPTEVNLARSDSSAAFSSLLYMRLGLGCSPRTGAILRSAV